MTQRESFRTTAVCRALAVASNRGGEWKSFVIRTDGSEARSLDEHACRH